MGEATFEKKIKRNDYGLEIHDFKKAAIVLYANNNFTLRVRLGKYFLHGTKLLTIL